MGKKTISLESMRLPQGICLPKPDDDIIVNLKVIYGTPGKTDKN